MKKDRVDVDIENEREWRRALYSEVKEIRRDISNLRVKMAVIGAFFGLVGSGILDAVKSALGR